MKGYPSLDSNGEAPSFMSKIQNSSVFSESASLIVSSCEYWHSTVYVGRESRLQWNPYKGQRFEQRHMCLRWLLHQEGRPEIDWTTKYIVFSKFESPAKVREWKRERESDLIERIPHTWPSSHENCFHSTLGSVSYCVVFLRRPPYWSVRVVLCNFKLGG